MNFDPFDFNSALPIINDDSEFFPLMSSEDEAEMNNEQVPDVLPILPLRNTVLFPGVVIPITVGRDKSIKLIRDAYKGNKTIGVVSQRNDTIEDPQLGDLNIVGTVAYIIKMLRMPDGNTTVIMQGKRRFTLGKETQSEPYMKATITAFPDAKPAKGDREFPAIISSVKDMAQRIIQINPQIPQEAQMA